jgi:hypothetical protein
MDRGRVPLLLAVLAVGVRLPAYLAAAHLHYDDGVYGISALGMRAGQVPFEDLFSPQGPLHLVLVRAGDLLAFESAPGPRTAPVLAGAGATVAAWSAGRRLGGRTGGVLAGLLVATTGTMLWTTAPITGDGIAVAFALGAVAAALAFRDRPSVPALVACGAAMGAALSTKALVLPAALPVGWWLWSARRRVADLAGAVAAAVVVGLAATVPFGFGTVWEQSVEYHRGSEYLYGPAAQARKLVSTLVDRDLLLLAAVALGLGWWWRSHRRGTVPARRAGDGAALAAWATAAALVLVFEPAMFRNHLATIAAPLALVVAWRPPPLRWFAIAAVVVAPWWVTHLDDLLWPRGYDGAADEVVTALRALPDGALVISDEPGLAWRAGYATVPGLNDTSIKRIDQGQITTASVADAAARDGVCAVVVWSNRFARELPGLAGALADAGYETSASWPPHRALWQRPCPGRA